jgi:hypothetical protein
LRAGPPHAATATATKMTTCRPKERNDGLPDEATRLPAVVDSVHRR